MSSKKNKNKTENGPKITPESAAEFTPEVEATNEEIVEVETTNNEETAPEVEASEVEAPKSKKTKVEKVIADVTPKDAFLKGLYSNEGKYIIVSNGTQLCSYLNKPNIAIFDTHFELNGLRYSYSGIEVKHV